MRGALLALIGLLAVAAGVLAATKEWRWEGKHGDTIFQMMADGAGGVAMVTVTLSNNRPSVVWLNKDGIEVYRHAVTNSYPRALIMADKKRMLYYDIRTNGCIVEVAADGTARLVTEYNANVVPSMSGALYRPETSGDTKGFFTTAYNSGPTGRTDLVRYRYK